MKHSGMQNMIKTRVEVTNDGTAFIGYEHKSDGVYAVYAATRVDDWDSLLFNEATNTLQLPSPTQLHQLVTVAKYFNDYSFVNDTVNSRVLVSSVKLSTSPSTRIVYAGGFVVNISTLPSFVVPLSFEKVIDYDSNSD